MKKKSTLSQAHTSLTGNQQTTAQTPSSILATQGYTKKKGCNCGKK